MSSPKEIECCFRGCFDALTQPDVRIEVYATEKGSSIFWAHKKCINARLDPSVMPDKPEEHGSIPSGAKCIFCGLTLPNFGIHPYCFDAGEKSPPDRFWSHNECMKACLKLDQKNKLPF